MLTWIVYDISKDKTRNKVAKICKNYGLYRVQKSAFLGDLNKNQIDEIIISIKEIADKEKDSIYIFPMCSEDFEKVKMIGIPFDEDLVSNKVKSFFV